MGRKSAYSAGVFNQLSEVMERLSAMESECPEQRREITGLNAIAKSQAGEIDRLKEENSRLSKENTLLKETVDSLTGENRLLRDDNERMKRLLHNGSLNSSSPPSGPLAPPG